MSISSINLPFPINRKSKSSFLFRGIDPWRLIGIFDSFNVSSVTDNGEGKYTVNMSITMPNINYAVVTDGRFNTTDGAGATFVTTRRQAFTTTTFGIRGSNNQGQFDDLGFVCGVVFGDQ